MAAQRTPARSDSSQQLRFVAHADLTQLDAHAEHTRQILDELPEVHAPVRSKVKDDLRMIERIFHIDQLHIESVLVDFLLTKRHRRCALFLIFRMAHPVLFAGSAQDRLQGCNDLFVIHYFFAVGGCSVFDAAGGFYDYIVTGGDLQIARIEVINFSCFPKANSYNLRHTVSSVVSRLSIKRHKCFIV